MLYLDSLDHAGMAGQVRAATAGAAGYSVARLPGPTPPEHQDAVAAMYQVLNDAPQVSSSQQDEQWTAGRVAAEDQWHAARGNRVYAILARTGTNAQPAGLTRIVVRSAGDLALQLETAVAAAHRGHRLGYLMKATMLSWLLEAEPQVRRISTFNTASNAHMIAVNAELGYIPVERWTFFERPAG